MRSVKASKKKPEELKQNGVRELEMTPEDWQEFEHGVQLFNGGKFWNSHEAWEQVWRRHDEDERIFLQGIIQLAAAYHQLVGHKSFKGMMNNFDKAYAKLELFRPEYLGVQIDPLLEAIRSIREEANGQGDHGLEGFDLGRIPKMFFRKPTNPDLMVGMRDFIRSAGFEEGLKNFNAGYFWEAHEIWEEAWREQDDEAKEFVQSFVQLASGYSFLKQGKVGPSRYLFEKSLERFRQFEYLECGVELSPLILQIERLIVELDGLPPNGNINGRMEKPVIRLKPQNGHAVLN